MQSHIRIQSLIRKISSLCIAALAAVLIAVACSGCFANPDFIKLRDYTRELISADEWTANYDMYERLMKNTVELTWPGFNIGLIWVEHVGPPGVVISRDGYVLTTAHGALSVPSSCKVRTYTGKKYDAELVGYNTAYDVALFKCNNAQFDYFAGIDEEPELFTGKNLLFFTFDVNGSPDTSLYAGYVVIPHCTNLSETGDCLLKTFSFRSIGWNGLSGTPVYTADGILAGIMLGAGIEPYMDTTEYLSASPIVNIRDILPELKKGEIIEDVEYTAKEIIDSQIENLQRIYKSNSKLYKPEIQEEEWCEKLDSLKASVYAGKVNVMEGLKQSAELLRNTYMILKYLTNRDAPLLNYEKGLWLFEQEVNGVVDSTLLEREYEKDPRLKSVIASLLYDEALGSEEDKAAVDTGKPLQLVERAFELNPEPSYAVTLFKSYFAVDDYDKAAEVCREILGRNVKGEYGKYFADGLEQCIKASENKEEK